MPILKKWSPIIGEGVIVAVLVAGLLGSQDMAALLGSIAGATGLTSQAPVPLADLAPIAAKVVAVGAMAFGLVRLLAARINALRIQGGGWKRWTPIVGQGLGIVIVTARLFGEEGIARGGEAIGALTGILGDTPIPIDQLTDAGAQIAGVVGLIAAQAAVVVGAGRKIRSAQLESAARAQLKTGVFPDVGGKR